MMRTPDLNRRESTYVRQPTKVAVRMRKLVGETGDIDEIRSINENDLNSADEDRKVIEVEDIDVVVPAVTLKLGNQQSDLAKARAFKVL